MGSGRILRHILLLTPHHALEGILDLRESIWGYKLRSAVSVCRTVSGTNVEASDETKGERTRTSTKVDLRTPGMLTMTQLLILWRTDIGSFRV